jgi:hypothetical protein
MFSTYTNNNNLEFYEVGSTTTITLSDNCKSEILIKWSITGSIWCNVILPTSAYLGKKITIHGGLGSTGIGKSSGYRIKVFQGSVLNTNLAEITSGSTTFLYLGNSLRQYNNNVQNNGWIVVGDAKGTDGSWNVGIGTGVMSNGSVNTIIGYSAQNNGYAPNCTAIGYLASTFGSNSIAIGQRAQSQQYGVLCIKVSTDLGTGYQGDSQFKKINHICVTTSNTPQFLVFNQVYTNSSYGCSVINNTVLSAKGNIIARDVTTGDSCIFEISFLVKRGVNASTLALVGTPIITKTFSDTNSSTWTLSLAMNITTGVMEFTCTGEASKSIRWVSNIDMTECS